ncbi:E3 ubiquitin-protein ligase MARCHF3 isoform X1 [Tyto alba]|uniref:E3 ubiquitin-protein ligase MARCHF3 isoform X1 n=1 Tax=Tyto alba TaxID=56313 RepID=UPI001C6652C3|nr:E3 ubiquitin-protein ligase MARCHF3 isoform X1 [Tyto alba]
MLPSGVYRVGPNATQRRENPLCWVCVAGFGPTAGAWWGRDRDRDRTGQRAGKAAPRCSHRPPVRPSVRLRAARRRVSAGLRRVGAARRGPGPAGRAGSPLPAGHVPCLQGAADLPPPPPHPNPRSGGRAAWPSARGRRGGAGRRRRGRGGGWRCRRSSPFCPRICCLFPPSTRGAAAGRVPTHVSGDPKGRRPLPELGCVLELRLSARPRRCFTARPWKYTASALRKATAEGEDASGPREEKEEGGWRKGPVCGRLPVRGLMAAKSLGASRTEGMWLRNPGPQHEKRTLFGDMVCFLFITPLATISGWLCLRGAVDHLHFSSTLEAVGLIALTVALFTIYLFWTLVSFRYHCRLYNEWRRTNQQVILLIPKSANVPSNQQSLLGLQSLKRNSKETIV